MANTQIDIKENGTTVLATAGKYCDRNIDVNVNVEATGGLKPTQFTNILRDEATIITPNYRLSSTAGATSALNSAFVVEFTLPANTPKIFRFRGYIPYGSYVNYSRDGGETWSMAYFSALYSSIDEYGDMAWGTTMGTAAITTDILLRFSLQFAIGSASAPALTEETIRNQGIVTINEPIGNIDPNS